ncbi:MAG: FdtA/QdtA family cupin domain-containing protein [Cytophagaceae bacterium]|nr:FdtA/QdtA family cupin domain-containing protein [Cytophagaceae bacterium]
MNRQSEKRRCIFKKMALLHTLPVHSGQAGNLTVFEKLLPGDVKRAFYIENVPPDAQRANHGHRAAHLALLCLKGQCQVYVKNKLTETTFQLAHPAECLVLEPGDWHTLEDFSSDALLMVLSNRYYDPNDYFVEKP